MSAWEAAALSQLVGEMLAEGMVERDNEVLVMTLGLHTFMVEIKVLDVTESAKEES